jgi:hypothetical protein
MISAEGHRGQPLICLLIRLGTSNEPGALPRCAVFSALPIEPIRALMNRNPQSGCTANYFTRTREKWPGADREEFALTAGPGSARGDAGPLARSAPTNSNVLARFLAGEVRGGGPFPVHRRENLKVVSFAANSRAIMAIWAAGVGALSRPPLAGPAGKSFTIILAIFRNSCRWRLPAGGRPTRGRVRPAAVIPAGAGVQERGLGRAAA